MKRWVELLASVGYFALTAILTVFTYMSGDLISKLFTGFLSVVFILLALYYFLDFLGVHLDLN